MSSLIKFCSLIYVLNSVSSQFIDDVTLIAVTDLPYDGPHHLYSDEVNPDEPTHWEDKTKSDPMHRLRICEQITNTDAFRDSGQTPFDMLRDQEQLKQPIYEDIYRDLFTDGILINRYRPRKFNVSAANLLPDRQDENEPVFVEDFVFTCLLREEISDFIIPVYVTKLYKADSELHAHRFVLEERTDYLRIMLAEAPAKVHAPPDFSVEVHYLRLKSKRPVSATSSDYADDPMSRLVGIGQFHRLCVKVLSSPRFKSKGVARVLTSSAWISRLVKFSFKTKEGREMTGVSPFSEFLTVCYVRMTNDQDDIFYLSRAYKDHEVLVSVQDPTDEKFYLDSLCINIGMLNDRPIPDDVHP